MFICLFLFFNHWKFLSFTLRLQQTNIRKCPLVTVCWTICQCLTSHAAPSYESLTVSFLPAALYFLPHIFTLSFPVRNKRKQSYISLLNSACFYLCLTPSFRFWLWNPLLMHFSIFGSLTHPHQLFFNPRAAVVHSFPDKKALNMCNRIIPLKMHQIYCCA